MTHIESTADVSADAQVGEGTTVWHLAQIRERAVVGTSCIIGRGAYLGPGVRLGDRCKVQNYALVYEPAVLEDEVFVGPAVVLTNDQYPRAATTGGTLKRGDDWDMVGVRIRRGASVGARAVCVAPVTIGSWAMVAAGSVVVRDVPDFSLVAGVPARHLRWVGRAGVPLEPEGDPGAGTWRCPVTGEGFTERAGRLTADGTGTPGLDGVLAEGSAGVLAEGGVGRL